MNFLSARWSRAARHWSNAELQKYAHLFGGDVVNVSGWRDEDKQGRHYRDYFPKATSYTITNYKAEARGLQGTPGEIFLDLEQPLAPDLEQRFDVVFNHTVLEHVYECRTAFANLCNLSRDLVIVTVPFLQPYHAPTYGDYWRFTPQAVQRMFADNGFSVLTCTFNEHLLASVYVFAIGTRHPARWASHFSGEVSVASPVTGAYAGAQAIPKELLKQLRRQLRVSFKR